ncbi:MAG: hypothetical protein H0W99_17310 [Acidobacteria bacterium]|nr:hypothetical protein [Acidobacteriota bacterium]
MDDTNSEYTLTDLNAGRQVTLHQANVGQLYAEIKRKTRSSLLVYVQGSGDAYVSLYGVDHGGSWAEAKGLVSYLKRYVKRLRPGSLR